MVSKIDQSIKRNYINVILAGILLSLAIQVISMIDLTSQSILEIFKEDFGRILISSIVGACLFILLYFLSSKFKNQNIHVFTAEFLMSFRIFLFYILLQGQSESLFFTFLGLVILKGILSYIDKQQPKININTNPNTKNTLIAALVIAYFSTTAFIYQGDYDFFTITRTFCSLAYFAIPVYVLGRYSKPYLILICVGIMLHAIPPIYHQYMFGQRIDQSAYYAILESPLDESLEFLYAYSSFKIIGLLLLYLVFPVYLILRIKPKKIQSKSLRLSLIPVLILMILISVGNKNYRYNVLYGLYQNLESYKAELDIYNKALEKRKHREVVFSDISQSVKVKEKTFVFIIGESTGRNHMGLYEYGRNTNPELSAIKDELLVYNDVISPHSHTKLSLEKMLSFGNHVDMKPFYDEGTIIELFKAAGFKTYWLSNQQLFGKNETIISSITNESDYTNFVNRPTELDNAEPSYDKILLSPFKEILNEGIDKKFT